MSFRFVMVTVVVVVVCACISRGLDAGAQDQVLQGPEVNLRGCSSGIASSMLFFFGGEGVGGNTVFNLFGAC